MAGIVLTTVSFMAAIFSTANTNPTQFTNQAFFTTNSGLFISTPSIKRASNLNEPMGLTCDVTFEGDLFFNDTDYNSYYFTNMDFSITLRPYRIATNDTITYLTEVNLYYEIPFNISFDQWDRFEYSIQVDMISSVPRIYLYSYDGDLVSSVTGGTYYLGYSSEYSVKTTLHENYFHEQVTNFILSQSYGGAFENGYQTGYINGVQDGNIDGYQAGYTAGYTEASNQDQTAVAIFTGICEVGLLPVNVFLGILNFEVFGINIGALMASLMTVAIVVIVIRVVLGAKGGGKGD